MSEDSTFIKAKHHFYCGLNFSEEEKWEDAEREFRISLTYRPKQLSTINNLVAVLIKQKKLIEAKELQSTLVSSDESSIEALLNSGLIYLEDRDYEKALLCFVEATNRDPAYPEAWGNRGLALYELRRPEEAISCYARAIELQPRYADAWSNQGVAFCDLKRHREAIESFVNALKLNPKMEFLLGDLVHAKLKICDWNNLGNLLQRIERGIAAGEAVILPFPFLGLSDSTSLQKEVAKMYTKKTFSPLDKSLVTSFSGLFLDKKMRVGYFSADFHDHATMYLMAELFELHDHSEFEIYCFSFGPNKPSTMRARMLKRIDNFIDISNLSDRDAVVLARTKLLHIAIDLKGYTQDARPQIFYERVAPIQMSYLGYPGTMGMETIDYLIADTVLIPSKYSLDYSEKIVFLPICYQPNMSIDSLTCRRLRRKDFGLPETGFVFASFNNNWKILPAVFDIWMKIVRACPASVIWLYAESLSVEENLLREAESRGLEQGRIMFAPRLPHEEHLQRYAFVDLFLDTFPYNAHTTASDALRFGVPVITLQGSTFASRVASSVLSSVQLEELITHSWTEYEALAIKIASNAKLAAELKLKIKNNLKEAPLFKPSTITKKIETAYKIAVENYLTHEEKDHIVIN